MQDISNLPISVLYKTTSLQFCEKKGSTHIILQKKQEASSVLNTPSTLQEWKSPTYLGYS